MERLKFEKTRFIFAALALAILLVGLSIRLVRRPVTIDTSVSDNGQYTVCFLQTEPAAVYGPQKVRVVLKQGHRELNRENSLLYNDGKALDENNWSVVWLDDSVTVTLHGEEQADETITFHLSGSGAGG